MHYTQSTYHSAGQFVHQQTQLAHSKVTTHQQDCEALVAVKPAEIEKQNHVIHKAYAKGEMQTQLGCQRTKRL